MAEESEILASWMAENNLNANRLASKIGVTRQLIYGYLSDKWTGDLPKEFKQKLSLAGFTIPQLNVKPFDIGLSAIDYGDSMIMNVPFVNQHVYAGYMRGYTDNTYISSLPKIPWLVDREYKGNYMAFEVKGDSMDDGSRDSYIAGDIVLCREIKQDLWKSSKLHIRKWDFVIAHKTDGLILKQIIEHNVDKGVIRLHSLNEQYPDYDVSLADVLKIFNVVRVDRKK
jgi:SOS-response transcriptional repressor LexA/predicted DNA-binding transcriptional regulator AlpA